MHKLDGIWDVTVKTFIGDQSSVLDIKVDGDVLIGTTTDKNSGNSCEISDGKVSGDDFNYKASVKLAIGTIEFTVNGMVSEDGKSINGKSENAMGVFDLVATKR